MFSVNRLQAIVSKYNLPVIVDAIGNKGCITFLQKASGLKELANYQDYIRNVDMNLENSFVLFMINRGLWVQPRDEWSISYQHTMADAEKFIALFEQFALIINEF